LPFPFSEKIGKEEEGCKIEAKLADNGRKRDKTVVLELAGPGQGREH
jgi:hypothetical protein